MIGILLINLGTPAEPTETAVRSYLSDFLSDPYVITLPKILRDFLVQKIILKKRPRSSAHAYQQIWTEHGSPLLVNSIAIQQSLQNALDKNYCVELGMRYSEPSIEHAIIKLIEKKCEKIIVLPLYPQFAAATTQSSLDVVTAFLEKNAINIPIKIISDFHHHDFYTHSLAKLIDEKTKGLTIDYLLLSYHGLPKRQDKNNRYSQQCHTTSQSIAQKLNLPSDRYLTTFQSRLGLAKWIEPYTDHTLIALRKKGVNHIAVVSPSFIADCVETLEEIQIRLREQWMQLGGKTFHFIPCLNATSHWIESLRIFIKSHGT